MKGETEEDSNNPMVIILGALIGIALLIIVGIGTAAGLFLCKRKSTPENDLKDVFSSSQKKMQENLFQVPILSDTVKSKKINNSAKKKTHEILPLDDINSLKPFAEGFEENVPTAIIKKNRGSAARQIRNSLSLSTGNPCADLIECRPIPVEIKPLNFTGTRNSVVLTMEDLETEGVTRPNNREENTKKSHARVTLNPDGEVLKCVIEGEFYAFCMLD